MFTGIVEELGEVESLERAADSARLSVRAQVVTDGVRPGDSIAVNGCCLTVVDDGADPAPGRFTADVMAETLDRTAIGTLARGERVNLERATTPAGRLGGHLVQGHVDGVGRIVDRRRGERWEAVRISVPRPLLRYLAMKGSVAVDGVSLTISGLHDDDATFEVSLIPTTLELTTLGGKAVGDPVNIEVDVVAKYVERLLTHHNEDG